MNHSATNGPDSIETLESLFFQALDLPASQRSDFIARVGQDNPLILESLSRLLQADHDRSGLIDAAPWSIQQIEETLSKADGGEPTDRPGVEIGPYRLLQFVASGGMGTVWLAEKSEDGFRHRVALKLIKRGLDTDDILRRFRRERQVLAQLKHPNIARLVDGGATDDGRPYLVMEFIDGEPIDRWCDNHRLNIRDRLKLFLAVCNAVQHAHARLTVHRDLKPGNILIGDDGQPKLLDFGLAKILRDDGLPESSFATLEDHRFLTPRYASPEQIRGEPVSVAADVYSLGVLLYELVSGYSPYPVSVGTQREIEQAILHMEPTRPSAAGQSQVRSRDARADARAIAERRSTTETGLQKTIRGDLDTIVMAALQKDSRRRYLSVENFASDIERFLRGLPISAAPDSLTYRASRFVRRNKGLVAGLATAALALVAATIVSTTYAVRAQEAQLVAEDRTRVAESINEFLNTDLLAAADPKNTNDPDLTVREALSRAAENLGERFQDQPIVEAAIRHTIGETYLGLRQPAEAVPHLRRAARLRSSALGELDRATRLSKRELVTALMDSDQSDEARGLGEELLASDIQAGGPDSPEAMDTRYQMVQLIGLDMETAIVEYKSLLEWNRKARGVADPKTLAVMHSLSNLLLIKQRTDEAGPLIEEIWETTRELYPSSHPETLEAMLGRALFYGRTDRIAEAIDILQEGVEILKDSRSPDFADTGIWLTHLGIHLNELGRYAEAEAAYLESYRILAVSLGPEAGWTKGTARFLYKFYEKAGDEERSTYWRDRSTEAE